MNHEKSKDQAAEENLLSPNHRPQAVRKRPRKKTVVGLLFTMIVTSCLIVVLGILLLVLPIFKVKKVEIEGVSYYTYDEILKASGIQEGDEILTLDSREIINQIYEKCPYVEICSIVKKPFSVKIIVEERKDIKAMSVGTYTVVFDRDFRVLEILNNGDAARSPFLSVTLPAYDAASIRVGETIRFTNTDADYSYISRLCDALRSMGWYNEVDYADFSARTAVAFVYQGRFRIEIGTVKDLDTKLLIVSEMMKEKEKSGVDLSLTYAVIDVSNVAGGSTWRECASAEELY